MLLTRKCAECGKTEEIEIGTIVDTMEGVPKGSEKNWKIRWVENVGPQYICPDEKVSG